MARSATHTAANQSHGGHAAAAAVAENEANDARVHARRRVILGALVAGASIAALLYFFRGNNGGSLSARARELLGGATGFAREQAAEDGDADNAPSPEQVILSNKTDPDPVRASAAAAQMAATAMQNAAVAKANADADAGDPEELLRIAKAAKDAGFVLMGVTQCVWSRRQRELFGGATSPARKMLESIYIECRTRDMCPGVRGYPTWARGDQMFPGYRDAAAVKALVASAAAAPRVPMLEAAPEPVDDASLPEERPALAAPAPPTQPAASPSPAPAAAASGGSDAARSELARFVRSIATEVLSELNASSSAEHAAAEKKDEGNAIVEKARGVSEYPPLAVPDMPGTASWNVGPSFFVDQAMQGNLPRASAELDEPTIALAREMASTFEQIAIDQRRDPQAADFARVRLPHAAQISTGSDPLQDKRVMVP
jgi:hypothetical protein